MKPKAIFGFASIRQMANAVNMSYSTIVYRLKSNPNATFEELTQSIEINIKTRHYKTHSQTNTRLYRIWHSMKSRCYRPTVQGYHNYGGRGIKVCQEWLDSFEVFRDWAMSHGYRDDLQIDRKDNDKNYCPENCRWVTPKENCNNKNRNVRIRCPDGQKRTLSEISSIHQIPSNTLSRRYKTNPKITYKQLIKQPKQYACYKFNNKPIIQIAKEFGICCNTLKYRLQTTPGITFDELIRPTNYKRGKKI